MEREAREDPNGTEKASPSAPDAGERKDELGEAALDKVAGGLLGGGDDDLDDLEVERLRLRRR